ncbi:hypothetical protein [Sinorhizobium glycinis]|uniref:hypothetical protein n=1 Tax=Sinorhizobium glycinis TaxID=1472378 RepID=UPI000ACB1A78|nr:hypothetical protein [Sinorhizobium glycinis]
MRISGATTHVGGGPPAERAVVPAATEQWQAPERETSDIEALRRALTTARAELEAAREETRAAHQSAREDALRHEQALAAEGQRAASLAQELKVTRADLDAMKARVEEVANAATRSLTVVLLEIEHLQAKAAGAIRSKAAALRARHAVEISLADARRALEEERHRRAGYERELAVARQSIVALEARAKPAAAEQAAAMQAGNLAEAAARRALEEERHRSAGYERALAVARQSAVALEARAMLAAAEQAAVMQAGKLAEAAARRAGEALAAEREKGRTLARDLDTARQERDAARQELARISAAEREVSEDKRNRALATEREEDDVLKARPQRPTASSENGPKVRAGDRPSDRAKAVVRKRARSVRQVGSLEFRKVEIRKATPSVRSVTVVLPEALLPRRPPMRRRW